MFITFEGLDASGKSTQIELTAQRFGELGEEVVVLREPGGTPLGEQIRSLLLDADIPIEPVAEMFLFSAARSQLVRDVIRPARERGAVILCDRYVDSTTTYQGYGRNIPLDSIAAVNRIAIDTEVPDLTFFIDISSEEIQRRQQAAGKPTDRIENAGQEFYRRIRDGYLELARTEKRFKIIQGERPPESIFIEIWSVIKNELDRSTVP
jgi:dTMP kinase